MRRRLTSWFPRHDLFTETRRALVALGLVWVGMALSGGIVLWSLTTHQPGGVFQGLALLLFGWAFVLRA